MKAVIVLLLYVGCILPSDINSLTTFHRGNKLTQSFKKVKLSSIEVDPNIEVSPTFKKIKLSSSESDSNPVSFKKVKLSSKEIDPSVAPAISSQQEIEESENGGQELIASSDATSNNEIQEIAEESVSEASPAVSDVSTAGGTVDEPSPVKNENDQNAINKFCKCTDSHCDCCRNFALPLIPVRGPGCAKITYLGNEKMSVSIKYGDIVLATRTISGKLYVNYKRLL